MLIKAHIALFKAIIFVFISIYTIIAYRLKVYDDLWINCFLVLGFISGDL